MYFQQLIVSLWNALNYGFLDEIAFNSEVEKRKGEGILDSDACHNVYMEDEQTSAVADAGEARSRIFMNIALK